MADSGTMVSSLSLSPSLVLLLPTAHLKSFLSTHTPSLFGSLFLQYDLSAGDELRFETGEGGNVTFEVRLASPFSL